MRIDKTYRNLINVDDNKQLEVIFSPEKKMVVEAPAGYGKTSTLINKIGFLIYSKQISWPKKVLALSYSVNSAHKLKKDLYDNLSSKVGQQYENDINDLLTVCNYHSFARNILRIYGPLLHPNLTKIGVFENLDNIDNDRLRELDIQLDPKDRSVLSEFNFAVMNADRSFIENNLAEYNRIILDKIIPKNAITYDGILTLCTQIFESYPAILKHHQTYHPIILIDEFQDTNVLSLKIVLMLISARSRAFFFGDSLQRIYGFIGAVPNVLKEVQFIYNAKLISLEINYRFRNNPVMMLLDRNIRLNADNPTMPLIENEARIDFKLLVDQTEEVNYVLDKLDSLLTTNTDSQIAVLVRNRSVNLSAIINGIESQEIGYFNALFKETDSEYLSFHRQCSLEFQRIINKPVSNLNKSVLHKWKEEIRANYPSPNSLVRSLFVLLDLFIEKLYTDYRSMSFENKIAFIQDTLQHNGLKHYLRDIDARVVLSTVHAAKGLEWDYVILPDLENYSLPGFRALCEKCPYIYDGCSFKVDPSNQKRFLEELSVFYVAVTRARKQVFFSASQFGISSDGIERPRKVSCFLKMPGIRIN